MKTFISKWSECLNHDMRSHIYRESGCRPAAQETKKNQQHIVEKVGNRVSCGRSGQFSVLRLCWRWALHCKNCADWSFPEKCVRVLEVAALTHRSGCFPFFADTHLLGSFLPSAPYWSFSSHPSLLSLGIFFVVPTLFLPLLSPHHPLFSPPFLTDFLLCVFQRRQHLHRHADRLKKRPNKSLFPANRAIFSGKWVE